MARGELAVELPDKGLFAGECREEGDFRVMPCVLRGPAGVLKLVKIVGTNRRQRRLPGKITVGRAFLLDPKENFIRHAFDACLLSSARTGLCAALAVERLAPRRRRVAIIGAGRVGWYAGLYIAALGGVESIVLSDIDAARAAECAELLGEALPGLVVTAGEDVEADVVILATTSERPLIAPEQAPRALVISLGADADGQRELADGWAGLERIHVDTLDSLHFGDGRRWREQGRLGRERCVELSELYESDSDSVSTGSRLFISAGSALFDALAVGYLIGYGEEE